MTFLGVTMIIFAGMRWNTGTDWGSYRSYFTSIERRQWGGSGMEIGYEIIVRFFKMFISSDQTPFLFFCSIFIIGFTYPTVYKHSPFPLFTLFLLISYSLVGSGFGVRQDLSIALTLYSITFIKERSFYKYAVIVFIAALIHNSAVIFFPAYYIYLFKWNTAKFLIISAVVIAFIFLSGTLMQTFGALVAERKAEHYLEMGMDQFENPYVALMKGLSGRLLFLSICVWFVNYKTGENKYYNGLFNLYVFGIILYAIFSPINLIFSRLARPYDIFQILIIPLAYFQAKRIYKIFIVVIIVAFSILKFSTIIRNDDGVNIPYKSALSR
ncbi:MAG: EpsG family protein [Dyadobacter sp.]|uniref:EpsG family protein n=1 Tax=Dyadobacter sp. TaxID=1914288 RepID=UPI003267D524